MFVVKVGNLAVAVSAAGNSVNTVNLVKNHDVCFATVGDISFKGARCPADLPAGFHEQAYLHRSLIKLIASDKTPSVVVKFGKYTIYIDSNIEDVFCHLHESVTGSEVVTLDATFRFTDGSYEVFGREFHCKDAADMVKVNFIVGDIPVDKREAVQEFLLLMTGMDVCSTTDRVNDFVCGFADIIYGEHREETVVFRATDLNGDANAYWLGYLLKDSKPQGNDQVS